ncbi:gas vesicle protein GvpJ [Streptomyces sp. NPDC002250]|uniref:gas vesicle protein GvpJ n=1 Tax=Streptomyces sp. NPDC002250 TaxID=3364641 RepID=UPI0036939BC9
MTMTTARQQGGGGGSSGLYDVLELILDRGLVIDAFIRVSVIGIELITIDVRIVIASIDTYLRFAEACNRMDLESGPRRPAGIPQTAEDPAGQPDAEGEKSKGVLADAAETLFDAYQQARDQSAERTGGRTSPESVDDR